MTGRFTVPDNTGVKQAPVSINRGLTSDRAKTRILGDITNSSWEMSAQQSTELAENPDMGAINESVLKAAGLDVHLTATPTVSARRSTTPVNTSGRASKEPASP